jgi:hypothetical protein
MGTFLIDQPPYIGSFNLPERKLGEREGDYDRRMLTRGVEATILEICGWYLKDSLRVIVQSSESDAPRLIQATAGLRSYLFLEFANSMNLTFVTRPVTKVCEHCGVDFTPHVDHPRQRTCLDCQLKRDRKKHKVKYERDKQHV